MQLASLTEMEPCKIHITVNLQICHCFIPYKMMKISSQILYLLHYSTHTHTQSGRCSHFQSSMDLLWEECNITMTTNCTEPCDSTMQSVNGVMGCCLATFLTVSMNNSPCSPVISHPCSLAVHTLPLSTLTTLAIAVSLWLT